MTAKEWLSQLKDIKEEIVDTKKRKKDAYENVTDITSHMQQDKVNTSGKNTYSENLDTFTHYSVDYDKRCEELKVKGEQMYSMINKVRNSLYRNVLLYKYHDGMSLKYIAATKGLSLDYIKVVHRKALDEITTMLKNEKII